MSNAISTDSICQWQYDNGLLALCDCRDWAPTLAPSSIRLIAIDPPFFTGRRQKGRGVNPAGYADNWGKRNYYVEWLMERIAMMRDLLLPDGSILVHLDWHSAHYIKVAMDRLFGEKCFQNELIWFYQTGGASLKRFSRKHDTILWYTRSNKWVFHPERIKVHRSPKALERARNPKGARISSEDHEKLPGDVLFVPPLNPMALERTGYPTQKPVELMELFIEAMSEEEETIADFFCGSGSTIIAASKLNRHWLACDINPDAIQTVRSRLTSDGAPMLFP